MLGGSASPDTHAVLMSGESPLLTNGAGAAAAMDVAAQNRRLQQGQQRQQRPQGNPLAGRNGAAIPQLNGIAQVIGLALGSPEFQRH